MKVLIITRNIKEDNEPPAKKPTNEVVTNGQEGTIAKKAEEKIVSYGRVNINDALLIKKALNGLHDVKIFFLNDDIYSQIKEEKPDVIFNLCDDGFRGDIRMEPHVAALFDILNIPYTGNNYFTIALCQNKARAKDLLTFNGVLTPKFQVFTSAERKINPDLRYPMIVKPIREDGSIGIRERSVVNNEEQLKEEVDHVIDIYKQEALVEEFINGREFSVSLIGNKRPVVLPVAEIDFTGMPANMPRIFSYKAKWIKQSIAYKSTPLICPAQIDEKILKTIEEVSRKCYKIFGCRGYVRVDFRYDEKENKLYVLELNPNPDLAEDCNMAKSAAAAGMNYQSLILKLIELAMERKD